MTKANTVYIVITGTILADTGKAIKIRVEKISGEPVELDQPDQWFPLSQINKTFKDPNVTGEDWISASEWICRTKELI